MSQTLNTRENIHNRIVYWQKQHQNLLLHGAGFDLLRIHEAEANILYWQKELRDFVRDNNTSEDNKEDSLKTGRNEDWKKEEKTKSTSIIDKYTEEEWKTDIPEHDMMMQTMFGCSSYHRK